MAKGLDALSNQKILKGIYWLCLSYATTRVHSSMPEHEWRRPIFQNLWPPSLPLLAQITKLASVVNQPWGGTPSLPLFFATQTLFMTFLCIEESSLKVSLFLVMSVCGNQSKFQNMYCSITGQHSNLDWFLCTGMKKKPFKLLCAIILKEIVKMNSPSNIFYPILQTWRKKVLQWAL